MHVEYGLKLALLARHDRVVDALLDPVILHRARGGVAIGVELERAEGFGLDPAHPLSRFRPRRAAPQIVSMVSV